MLLYRKIGCCVLKDLHAKQHANLIKNCVRCISTTPNLSCNKQFIFMKTGWNSYPANKTSIQGQCSVPHSFLIDRRYSNKVDKTYEQLSSADKLKKAVKEYGSTVIIFHIGISLISLGLFYALVSSGVDFTVILQKIGFSDDRISKLAGNTGTFVIAYAIHKMFVPVRIGITLTATPLIVRHLRRIGWLKK